MARDQIVDACNGLTLIKHCLILVDGKPSSVMEREREIHSERERGGEELICVTVLLFVMLPQVTWLI